MAGNPGVADSARLRRETLKRLGRTSERLVLSQARIERAGDLQQRTTDRLTRSDAVLRVAAFRRTGANG